MEPCKVVIVVGVVAVVEVALVVHGSRKTNIDEDHSLQKRPLILPHRMATVPKTMARVYSLAMGLKCGALPRLFRSPRRWFPPAFCSGV